jgi:ribosomal protein S27E
MKIIKKGKPTKEISIVYRKTCPGCNTVFEFVRGEAITFSYDLIRVRCPVCGAVNAYGWQMDYPIP